MKFKIISDSSCNVYSNYLVEKFKTKEVGFEVIPFIINIDEHEFVDDDNINTEEMLKTLNNCKKTSSSCPAPQVFEDACTGDFNFIVTISSKLSGSYNSAMTVQDSGKNVFVIDSKGTGGMVQLIIDKLYELITSKKEFEDIKNEITKYRDGLNLFFTLTNYDNLVRKGRIKLLVAKIVSIAKIKSLCKAKDGEINIEKRFLSYNHCINWIAEQIGLKAEGQGDCIINFYGNEEIAQNLKYKLEKKNSFKEVILNKTKGLNAFYALQKSLIVSY